MTHSGLNGPILIAHVVYHLGIGGLENGLVNLINRLPAAGFRHLVISLTDYTEFAQRIQREDVEVIALHKRPGHDWRMFTKLYQLFRSRKPDIVHSRNLAALEAQLPARLAGVPFRIHGEHGRDVSDMDGTNWNYILQRRLFRPFIHHYIALSRDLEYYLKKKIGVSSQYVTRIINGVDTERFSPPGDTARDLLPKGFAAAGDLVIGTVGRLEPIKDQQTLVKAFVELLAQQPQHADRLRLVIVGDGSMRKALERILAERRVLDQVWFAGSTEEVPGLLRNMDIFVLPSLAEGISNTIMEAMATGLSVVATDVGGNGELVIENETGFLVPRDAPESMAIALAAYLDRPDLLRQHGRAARARAEEAFSLAVMVERYRRMYLQEKVQDAGMDKAD